MGQDVYTGDDVTITAGPLSGVAGRVLAADAQFRTAHVRVWIASQGAPRKALAVVSYDDLDVLGRDAPRARFEPERPRRGRPRLISDERVRAIQAMYATGRYSQAAVAQAHRVSKSSVALLVKRATEGSRS